MYPNSDECAAIFSQLLDDVSTSGTKVLKASCFDSPLGSILVVADETELYLLQFSDYFRLTHLVNRLKQDLQVAIVAGKTAAMQQIEDELNAYFAGNLREFKTPLAINGSSLQKAAWDALLKVPYAEVKSYKDQAELLGKPTAFRAVANANAVNRFVIVIPCHRIINANGKLGGYGGGLERKEWLLAHEIRVAKLI